MSVTASELYNFVECPKRVELDAFGDPARRDPENAFVKLLWERDSNYEKEVVDNLDVPFVDLSHGTTTDRERDTLAAMQRGDALIYGGRVTAGDLIGMPDLLRREGDGYAPIDIKSGRAEEGGEDDDDGKPKLHYAVQLALYIDVLEQLHLSAGRYGYIFDIRGNEKKYDFTELQGIRNPETLWDKYQRALGDARAIVNQSVQPTSAYAAVCKLCHWHTFCVAQLVAADDLTLIPSLGRKRRDAMLGSISTVTALAESDPEAFVNGRRTQFSGVGLDMLRLFQKRASLLKEPNAQPFLRAVVTLPAAATELFFDIEVDPMRDIVYLHGIIERASGNNESEIFVAFFADDVTDSAEKAAFANAMDYFRARPDAKIYYYSKYERTQYRKLREKYPDVATEREIEALFDPAKAIDLLYDVVTKATEWPTRDHSLKTLAKYLGFTWRDTHPSGAASIEWYDEWVRGRTDDQKQRILDYNEDDCRATRVLLDGIRALV
jgi:predicted RecB family nuclease